MERRFISKDEANQRIDNFLKDKNQREPDLDFEDKQEFEKSLEGSFLTDLNSQIELESQIIEESAKINNDNFRQSLLELRRSGEEFLKNISTTVVKTLNSNKFVVKLRDAYIEKRSLKIYQELSVTNELAKPEDYDSFIRMLKSDFWGTSVHAESAVFRADSALKTIAERFPEKTKDVLEVWPELFKKKIDTVSYNGFNDFINNYKGESGPDQENQDETGLTKFNDDFVALKKHLSAFSKNYSGLGVKEEVVERVDSIIAKHPGLEYLPKEMSKTLIKFAYEYPDEILADSRRVNLIFNLWKMQLKNSPQKNTGPFVVPILADRLKVCSPEESNEIISLLLEKFHNPSYYFSSEDFNWLLSILPIDKSGLKLLKNAPKNTSQNTSQGEILELNKSRAMGEKSPDRLFSVLLEESKRLNSQHEVVFISNLIVNYPDTKQGIGEEELITIIDSLLENQDSFSNSNNRFDINILHGLAELMSRHAWPDSLKGRIFSANSLSGETLNRIINGSEPEKHAWIEAEPLLMNKLQLSFHERAKSNDLRHYFYEVLDNKKQSSDLDDLIKSYGRSEQAFDFEEIRSLFFDKKIDKKYIPYFINKANVRDIITGLEGGAVSDSDGIWLLESAIKYGRANGAMKALRQLDTIGALSNPEKRSELINLLADNVLLKCDTAHDRVNLGSYVQSDREEIRNIRGEIFEQEQNNFLSPDEIKLLGRKILNGALDFVSVNNAGILILGDKPEKIKSFFPDDKERKEYLIKTFDKLLGDSSNDSRHLLIRSYFQNQELLSVLDESERLSLENKIFVSSMSNYSYALLDMLDYMDNNQQEAFISLFEKTDQSSIKEKRTLCYRLAVAISFFEHPAIFKRAYLCLLKDPKLSSGEADTLFKEEIVLSDKDLRDVFFANLIRWPEINGTNILKSMKESKDDGGYSLSTEEVKQISTTVMQNRGLSPEFWKGYQASDKTDPSFYLDQKNFRIGINNIGGDCLREPDDEIILFIKSLLESEFEFNTEDALTILKKALNERSNAERIKVFYQYDADFMEGIMSDQLDNYYNKALDAEVSYSPSFNSKLLDCILRQNFSQSTVDRLFGRIKKEEDLSMLAAAKKHLSTESTEKKIIGRMLLLKYDFLSVEESKEFYKEVTSSSADNVRTQILNSIDIISSMLSNRNNIDELEKFLDSPRSEDISNLKEISEFIEKYSQENKGRSIAVMLFAREYLPDRPLNEVIEKVAFNLRKSEEIINQNSYKNIPEGIRASIGMEYEITSSTAAGYQELTSQKSLKSDIARLSQAARIGSGRDAVHEIATRPTDNPYLMLLEMKLLHDIEYIDLNFDRSENYQKGARGFHLTIGGEKGLIVDRETNFLQNALIAASWGGVQSGETGHKVNGGRGVSLRNREDSSENNIAFFGKKTNSVELRSLTIDKQETLQRAVATAFNGAVAIQAFKELFPKGSIKAMELLETADGKEKLQTTLQSKGKVIGEIATLWLDLVNSVNEATKKHNESFLDNEMIGYLDDDGAWVDAVDFGGQYNRERFQSIVKNIDPTLSLEEYVKTTEIDPEDFFQSFSVELSDKLIKINNLYLKPGVSFLNNEGNKKNVFKGDQANSLSMLKITKIDNDTLENYDDYFLNNTIFDAAGEKRKGYYALQGGSEQMLTHAIQRALLDFNGKMEKILN